MSDLEFISYDPQVWWPARRRLQRQGDWMKRLQDYVRETQDGKFTFGERDCALWALGAVDAMCGTCIVAQFVGKYDDLDGAHQMLLRHGWNNLLEAATDILGNEPEFDFAKLHDGDAVWLPPDFAVHALRVSETRGQGVLGVLGSRRVWAPAASRLISIPYQHCAGRGCIGIPVS